MNVEGIFFVVTVSLLILFISSAYCNVYMAAIYHQDSTYFFIYSPIYLVIIALLLISYYRAVLTSPGFSNPLDNSKYSIEQIQIFMQNSQKQKQRKQERRRNRFHSEFLAELKETVYCDKCEAVKLPRVHHCKICERCILRMDHHCPWVGNCIGIDNHKYFMLFLLYATIGLTMTWVTLCIDWHFDWKFVSTFRDQETAVYLMIIVVVASIMLSLSIGSLLIAQVMGLMKNLTTLQIFVPLAELHPPFDRGDWKANFEEIFGPNHWLLPTKPEISYPDY